MYSAVPLSSSPSPSPALPPRQGPDITHAWVDMKPPVCHAKRRDQTTRYLTPLTREEIVASIHATKAKHQRQKEQGLVPDKQLVLVRTRPSQSVWGAIKDGVWNMASGLNDALKGFDLLPHFPFAMANGMPTGGQRIAAPANEPLEQALAAMYAKLEAADQYIHDLRDSISSLKTRVEDARNGLPTSTPTPSSGPTDAAQPGTYEGFRRHAESLGFEVELWNPVSHDVCDTSCNRITDAWTGPSIPVISLDGLPVICDRNNTDMTFLLMQEALGPDGRIITTDDQFGQKEECLNLAGPEDCIHVPRNCSRTNYYLPMLANAVRAGIKNSPRTFIDLDQREQDYVIADLRNPAAAVPHIRVSYRGAAANTTSPGANNLVDPTNDSVTILEFLRYAEALGLEARFRRRNLTPTECGDTFDVRNTRLNGIPIILSRGDPQASLSMMQAFIQPTSVIISTDPDFARTKQCLGLVRESVCIDQSNYCSSLKYWDWQYENVKRWDDVTQHWVRKLATLMQDDPNRRIFFDLSVDEHKALLREIDAMRFVLIGKAEDLSNVGGNYDPQSSVPPCPSESPSQPPGPAVLTPRSPATASYTGQPGWPIAGVAIGLAGLSIIGMSVYAYRKTRDEDHGRSATTTELKGVTVAGKDNDRNVQMSHLHAGDDRW